MQPTETPQDAPGATTDADQASRPRTWPPTWLRRILPLVSLAVSLASALQMKRTPDRAPIVAGAALLVWLTLTVRSGLSLRARPPSGEPYSDGHVTRVMRFSALFATQSMIQLCLFFTLPFYFAASTLDPGHVVFMTFLTLLALSSMWDPWTEWLLERPGIALLFPAVASFLALSAVLPGFSFDNRRALWTAALCAALGAFASSLLSPFARNLRQRVQRALTAALVPIVFLAVGGARLVPAAPMRLVKAAFGTGREGHWVNQEVTHLSSTPAELVCATALYAPLGVHETLYHVWEHEGEEHQRIALSIVGGRKRGFRTRSIAHYLGPSPRGHWTCSVMTEGGQFLGATALDIGAPR